MVSYKYRKGEKEMRIELTDEVVKAITANCPVPPDHSSSKCFEQCALAGACLEYYTGDDSQNSD
jgi:hypothetical protein